MKKIALIPLLVVAIIMSIIIYVTTSRIFPDRRKAEGPATASVQTPEAAKSASRQKMNTMAAANPTTVPPNTIATTNLPEHLRTLVENYAYEPQWSTARKLTPADKTLLLQLYRQEPSLLKKFSLTLALGFVGDEEVVELFKHTLSDQYAGRKLTTGKEDNETNEEIVMHKTVEALGFLANKSDSAYQLLKKGIDPKFWKEYCQFTPASGPDFYGTLTVRSIQAIGWSGRSDVVETLESLKSKPLLNILDDSIMQMSFDGAVVDAAFANDIITKQGLEYYKYLYLNVHSLLERMNEWKKEGSGTAWRTWRRQRGGKLE